LADGRAAAHAGGALQTHGLFGVQALAEPGYLIDVEAIAVTELG